MVSGIVLQRGPNVVTVTARDAANNAATDTLTITYTPQGESLAAAYSFEEGRGTTVSGWVGQQQYGDAEQHHVDGGAVGDRDSLSMGAPAE